MVICWIIGHAEPIKTDSHLFENFIEVSMIILGDGTRSCMLSFCCDNDRSSVIVGTADKHDVIAKPAQVADIEVAGNVGPQVAKMAQTIGIGKTTGDDCRLIGHSGYYFGMDEVLGFVRGSCADSNERWLRL